MSSSLCDTDVLDIILKHNLELINDTYIILNVVANNNSSSCIQPMCIGQIDSFKEHQTDKNSMSTSSVSSELPSDQTI
ncbi:Late expression factor 10 [Perigonia lusca single nucleopolyhedrovirus]|uniref:Late expression factor 10 n=1 Tax=Perigonia lusca single nucleopolyhedrovirus TaxID=1675865 RepID=A0A0M3WP00_9ABAC|nr:Late expression factor 10 [Perigonia lusca single nucleopolyhedrovirus]AKN80636.1 Late expression factor 10 [Perigonia lusca single nucleopolyhedrovirus]